MLGALPAAKIDDLAGALLIPLRGAAVGIHAADTIFHSGIVHAAAHARCRIAARAHRRIRRIAWISTALATRTAHQRDVVLDEVFTDAARRIAADPAAVSPRYRLVTGRVRRIDTGG